MLYRKLFVLSACVVALFAASFSTPASAAPGAGNKVGYELTLDFSAPTWSAHQGYIDSASAVRFDGCLKVLNLIPSCPVRVVVAGKHTFGDYLAFDSKNEMQGGIEFPLDANTTFFSYYKQNYKDVNDTGVYCGVEFQFKG